MYREPSETFLNVARSVLGNRWLDRLDEPARRQAAAISQRSDTSEIVARILAGRGVEVDQAESFLDPTLKALMPDPSTMTGMDEVAARLAQAITGREQVAFFGDYDVDGASSCALMLRYFRHFGLQPQAHIPDRIFEGYGPNIPAIDHLIAEGATLLVMLDCGTSSMEPVAHARARGCDVLVLDHHMASGQLPDANAIVNPNRQDDVSGLGYLCAAGVTFMALVATNRVLREAGHAQFEGLQNLLDLVALATICDVVPLKGLNRAFVRRGIRAMHKGRNPGIRALSLAARINGPLAPAHLGFALGPRINAGGRIGDAGLGTRLLATAEEDEAMRIAARLDELNAERQAVEAAAVEEATSVALDEIGARDISDALQGGPDVLVLASESWHPGVVGLVAARLRERFQRPAFAIAIKPDGSASGSGRSMPGVDIGKAVIGAVEKGIIEKGGGHPMAAGVSLDQGQIGAFRAHVNEELADQVHNARSNASIRIDAAITARSASVDFVRSLAAAGPFGTGNPSPVFALPSHRITYARIVGKGGHVQCTIASGDGASLRAIAFRSAHSELGQTLLAADRDRPLHLCGTLNLDVWQGVERVQMRLVDAADPERCTI